MLYKEFVDKVMAQDGRNVFAQYTGDLSECAESTRKFYQQYNPVDVEFTYKNADIRMIPADELRDMAGLYADLEADMIFAECSSDPFFIKGQAVYTCMHGVKNPKLKKLADSFDEYLSMITNEI